MLHKSYHILMYHVKRKLWHVWHVDLRISYGYSGSEGNRPWYHLCCNGNAGGWRTSLCDMLEDESTGWRYHEMLAYPERWDLTPQQMIEIYGLKKK